MEFSKKLNSDYSAMADLTKEIGSLVERSINQGRKELSPSDIEHILKMTSDVTIKIKSKKLLESNNNRILRN